jgi:hypothetical protein
MRLCFNVVVHISYGSRFNHIVHQVLKVALEVWGARPQCKSRVVLAHRLVGLEEVRAHNVVFVAVIVC